MTTLLNKYQGFRDPTKTITSTINKSEVYWQHLASIMIGIQYTRSYTAAVLNKLQFLCIIAA